MVELMNLFKKQKRDSINPANHSSIAWFIGDTEEIEVAGYTSLSKNPDVMTACRTIATLIGTMTIHLMANTEHGDQRIVNALSRAIDIDPMPTMPRSYWMESIVMNMLLYGKGNSVVWPHTWSGLLQSLEPIAASRVSFLPDPANPYREYKILIDGKVHDPSNMLHFRINPDEDYLWKGRGLDVSLREVANSLKQADATKKGFLKSKWKPSLIVKVDAMADEFSGVEGRKKLREDYLDTGEAGAPWIIPAQQFDVKEVRPLSLSDLAIADVMKLDKATVASIIGVPSFVLGIGKYDQKEWNSFIQNRIRPIAKSIEQEMTKKLIISPKMYLKFNTLSLMDWDIQTIAQVFGSLSDRGFVTGNEVRDKIGMSPAEGLDEYRVLENYIPYEMSGKQKKLVQEEEDDT